MLTDKNLEDLEKIRHFADQAHGGQLRKYTPERYIVHPVRVMETLKKYTDDLTVLAAALLHDVLEDTTTTILEIENKFNKNIAQMIFSVSGFGQNRKERNQNIKEKLLLNPQHIDLKLADRIANMRNSKENNLQMYKMYMNELSTFQELAKNGCDYFKNILQNEFLNQVVIKKNKIN